MVAPVKIDRMNPGVDLLIEKCASGFVVRPSSSYYPGATTGATRAFSDVGDLLTFIEKHFTSK